MYIYNKYQHTINQNKKIYNRVFFLEGEWGMGRIRILHQVYLSTSTSETCTHPRCAVILGDTNLSTLHADGCIRCSRFHLVGESDCFVMEDGGTGVVKS
jgi:hypothetical protein